jgi:hypothetical protein
MSHFRFLLNLRFHAPWVSEGIIDENQQHHSLLDSSAAWPAAEDCCHHMLCERTRPFTPTHDSPSPLQSSALGGRGAIHPSQSESILTSTLIRQPLGGSGAARRKLKRPETPPLLPLSSSQSLSLSLASADDGNASGVVSIGVCMTGHRQN